MSEDFNVWLPRDEDYDKFDDWIDSRISWTPQELSDFAESLGGYIYPVDTVWH